MITALCGLAWASLFTSFATLINGDQVAGTTLLFAAFALFIAAGVLNLRRT